MLPQRSEQELRKELKELEELLRYKEGLPHLIGQKFYPWARRVWDSNKREIFVCSANQVGKSSIAIRKNIRLATDPTLWPKFWPGLHPGTKPNLFWYFYPTMPVAHTEFETKWEPLFLPRGEFKNHPQFGWEPEFEKGLISKIRFKSGVQIQFKSYSMKVKDLQTATVYHVTSDEELPVEFLPEIAARTNASDGHFLMVFTATLGQMHWQQTMEPSTKGDEKHPDALKIQVSLYDSMFFDDGTPSHWTQEKINRAIANCPTEAEIQRRVYGRFVKASGLLYESFTHEKNYCLPHKIPEDWVYFGAVDIGSGGQSGHPAAMAIIATSSDFKQGRVFRAWRGDGIPTTSSDIVDQFRELKKGIVLTNQTYDFASADFFTVASRMGEPFAPANKKREAGIDLLNTLFKTGMLKIFRDDPELEKLVTELCSLGVDENKRKALDDLSDALRYCAISIPWNFEDVQSTISVEKALEAERLPVPEKTDGELRREWFIAKPDHENENFDQEFDFWNENSGASESDQD
jgi:phage terminase large subunit-like protein